MYSMVAPLPELEAGLFFDAPECSFWNVPLRVYNCNPSRLGGMLELLVAAGLRNLEPPVIGEPADDFPAVHCGASFNLRIHIPYILIKSSRVPHPRRVFVFAARCGGSTGYSDSGLLLRLVYSCSG